MNITFAKKTIPTSGTVAITVYDKMELGELGKQLDKKTKGALKRAAKAAKYGGTAGQLLNIIAPAGTRLDRVILVGLGKADKVDRSALERAGAAIARKFVTKDKVITLGVDTVKKLGMSEADLAAQLGFGAQLGGYRFTKYRTKLKSSQKPKLNKISVLVDNPTAARAAHKPYAGLAAGVYFARDLVNEPANVLDPKEFAERCKAMNDTGLKVSVMGEKKMKELGMGALLGVSQGSVKEAQMVFMEWNGGEEGEAPLAFVGKGLTFDSGGISLKPGAGMEDMKGDMGGAAAVAGLMCAIAKRKAKANVLGVIACVENMPDADAQRPGDVVTSMSGQTIEIINTDAEGRLVLADALWYVQQEYKPKFMVDLATLTGAMMIALGDHYAGFFTNSDEFADQFHAAGQASNEGVWRMPLGPEYDKQINSSIADMKNTGGRKGGSITAAQFLQRFTNKTPWCHVDVAGTAMGTPTTDTSPSWASGFGVRVLNQWVLDNHEGE